MRGVNFFLMALAAIVVLGGVSAPQDAFAKVLCGGVGLDGNVQEPCGYEPATFLRPASHQCPTGSIFNVKTFACWKKCPPNYRRTLKSVDGPEACKRTTEFSYASASAIPGLNFQCPAGTVSYKRDTADGVRSVCVACPKGSEPQMLPNGGVACMSGINVMTAPDRIVDGCPRGFAGNGKCWTCPEGHRFDAQAAGSSKACFKVLDAYIPTEKTNNLFCNKKEGEIYDPSHQGTCWTCPKFTKRSMYRIDGERACASIGIKWETPPFVEPGLLGLDGARAAIADLLSNDRQTVQNTIEAQYDYLKGNNVDGLPARDAYIRGEWNIIAKDLRNSTIINALVFGRMLNGIPNGGATDPVAKKLITSMEEYIVRRRAFIPQDALNMYEAWVAGRDAYYKDPRNRDEQGEIYKMVADYLKSPPDFAEIAREGLYRHSFNPVGTFGPSVFAFAGKGGALHVGYWGASEAPEFVEFADDMIIRYSSSTWRLDETVAEDVKTLAVAAMDAKEIGTVTGKVVKGVTKAKSVRYILLGARALAGPTLVGEVAFIVAEFAIDRAIDIATARKKLRNALAAAKQPISLQALYRTTAAMPNMPTLPGLRLHWANATGAIQSSSVPRDIADLTSEAVQLALAGDFTTPVETRDTAMTRLKGTPEDPSPSTQDDDEQPAPSGDSETPQQVSPTVTRKDPILVAIENITVPDIAVSTPRSAGKAAVIPEQRAKFAGKRFMVRHRASGLCLGPKGLDANGKVAIRSARDVIPLVLMDCASAPPFGLYEDGRMLSLALIDHTFIITKRGELGLAGRKAMRQLERFVTISPEHKIGNADKCVGVNVLNKSTFIANMCLYADAQKFVLELL